MEDINETQRAVGALMSESLSVVLNLILVLTAMFWLSWQLSLVALAVIPLFVPPGAVDDHGGDIGPRRQPAGPFCGAGGQFGERVAELAAAVTNPVREPSRDEHEQYRERVAVSCRSHGQHRAKIRRSASYAPFRGLTGGISVLVSHPC
jgi:hypothetical protein